MDKRANASQMIKRETRPNGSSERTQESSCLPRHSRRMDDLDLILCHEDFPRVLVLVCELMQLRVHPSKEVHERENCYEPRNFYHGSSEVLNVVDRMQKQLLTPDMRNRPPKKDDQKPRVSRGQDPITDSLLDDAIALLQEELSLVTTKKTKKIESSQGGEIKGHFQKDLPSKKKTVPLIPNKSGPAQQQRNKSSDSPIIIKYSKKQTDILMQWMIDHRDNPFPAADDIKNLVEKTDLSQKQVVNWTTNVRKRNRKATCDGAKKPHHFLDFLFLAQHREQMKAIGQISTRTESITRLLPSKPMIPNTPKNSTTKKKSTMPGSAVFTKKEAKGCKKKNTLVKKRKTPNRDNLTPPAKRSAPVIRSATPTFSPYPRTPPVVAYIPPGSPYHTYNTPPPTAFEQQKPSPLHSYPTSCPPRPYPAPPQHLAHLHHPRFPPQHHHGSYMAGHPRQDPPRPEHCKSHAQQCYDIRQSMAASREIGGRGEPYIRNRRISSDNGANYVISPKNMNPQLLHQIRHPVQHSNETTKQWEIMERKAQRAPSKSLLRQEDKSDPVFLQPIPLDGPNDANILEAFATYWENDAGEIVPLELPELRSRADPVGLCCDGDFGLLPSVTDEEDPNNSAANSNSSSDAELDFGNDCYPLEAANVNSFDDEHLEPHNGSPSKRVNV